MFDKAAGLEKALLYIDEAAAQKPDLIVFPELFIPGYPIGMNFGFSMGKRNADGRKDWKRYYDASIVAGETEFQQLAEAAKRTGAYISLGFSELFHGRPCRETLVSVAIVAAILLIAGVVYSLYLHGDFDISSYVMRRARSNAPKQTFEAYKANQKERREASFNYPLFLGAVYMAAALFIAYVFY